MRKSVEVNKQWEEDIELGRGVIIVKIIMSASWLLAAKEVLQEESGRRLCYIRVYSSCTYMELFQ
jgi:hypothetical protein